MQSSERMKLLLDTKLSEYKELRTELRMNMQLQWSILAAFLALFGVLFVILFKQTDSNSSDLLNPIVISCVGCFVLPALGAATGVLWLDQVLRQMRIVDYVYKIEEQVKEILDGNEVVPTLNWEHEVRIDNIDNRNGKKAEQTSLHLRLKNFMKSIISFLHVLLSKKNGRFSPQKNSSCDSDKKNNPSRIAAFMNPNLFNYYAVLGILYLFPLFSFRLTLQILAPSKLLPVWWIAFIIVYIAFVLLSILQIKSILKHGQHEKT